MTQQEPCAQTPVRCLRAIAALALMPTQERDFATVEQVVRTLLLHDGAEE